MAKPFEVYLLTLVLNFDTQIIKGGMKYRGSLMLYSKDRAYDLTRAYEKCVASSEHISDKIYSEVVEMPASRFWVSDIRASLVVSAMMRGDAHLEKMNVLKREMYEEIYRRVMKLMEQRPGDSLLKLCSSVVCQPAPKFYLKPSSAKYEVCRVRKQWAKEKLKKLQRFLCH